MIPFIVTMILGFTWLLLETDWMRVRLLVGIEAYPSCPWLTGLWLREFSLPRNTFVASPIYPSIPIKHTGYAVCQIVKQGGWKFPEIYVIYSSLNTDLLVSREWLDKHWNDLENYEPKVELYFGNGYRQTFTLKKPELMKQIIHINCGKKYFKSLAPIEQQAYFQSAWTICGDCGHRNRTKLNKLFCSHCGHVLIDSKL